MANKYMGIYLPTAGCVMRHQDRKIRWDQKPLIFVDVGLKIQQNINDKRVRSPKNIDGWFTPTVRPNGQ
jgi:hypothetical protein